MRVRQVDIGARELIDRVARGLIQREQADRICVEEGSGSDAHLPRSPDGAAGRCWLPRCAVRHGGSAGVRSCTRWEYGSGADYRDRRGVAGRYLNVNAGLC
jgi:hypothetical protein